MWRLIRISLDLVLVLIGVASFLAWKFIKALFSGVVRSHTSLVD